MFNKFNEIKVGSGDFGRGVEAAVDVLEAGGIVVYPTETCYGVGVDATNQAAVDKLLRYKRRPEGKPISIAVTGKKMAKNYVQLNETAENLYTNFLPGPLTVISKSLGKVADGLEAEDKTLGIRVPDYDLALQIVKKFGEPITATSANISGKKTPYSVEDILNNTTDKQKELIDLILDAGKLPHNPPSTVVDTTRDDAQVIREGLVDLKKHKTQSTKLKKVISRSENMTISTGKGIMRDLLPKLKENCIIFALQGELGAGKTRFAKGIARGLGIEETIVSPTYLLVREYEFNMVKLLNSYIVKEKDSEANRQRNYKTLFHMDTWRMQSKDELLDLGFYDMLKPGNVIVVEWMEKVRDILEKASKHEKVKTVWVQIVYNKKIGSTRSIIVADYV